jgi:nucleoside 2-deoxyribosyltransferase
MTDDRKRIYFAAPLFTQAEWLWNARLTAELRASGVEVLAPQETAEPMLSGAKTFNPRKLFERNIKDIDKAKIVLAILDQADPDSGTCWECGYAFKAGYPIIGLRTDIRSGGDDKSHGVNLMLSRSCRAFVLVPLAKRDDLKWVAREVLKKLKPL